MVQLHGRTLTRDELARRTAATASSFGAELIGLSDGGERGVRAVELRTGTGLTFRVMVDRGMDIGCIEYRGAALGWRSPTGFRHPGLHEFDGERGWSWLRSFSGFLATCGLDHALGPASEPGDHYGYAGRAQIDHGLHGRVAYLPGRLTGYGERWDGDDCTLWCEGVVVQAAVFGENLELVRRYEAKAGTDRITLTDRVTNRGFRRTPHMLLYHVNLGWPLLDEGARFVAPIARVNAAMHEKALRDQGVGYRTLPGPRGSFMEQVFDYETVAGADGRAPYALLNPGFDGGRGLGVVVEVDRRELPCLVQWQAFQEGLYAMGIEPSTNHVHGRDFAKSRNELAWLEHGESRSYDLAFDVLSGAAALAAAEARIAAIQPPPADEYPAIAGYR